MKQKLLQHNLIKTFNAHNINPDLRKICIAFLQDDNMIFTTTFSPSHSHIIHLQRQLGKNSLYYGYFVLNWHIVQREYLKTCNITIYHNQAGQGIKAITYTIYTYVFKLWLLRNSHCHRGVIPGNISFARQTLLQELQALYKEPKDILTTDRLFFNRTRKQQTATTRTHSLRQLVRDTKMILKQSLRDAINIMKNSPTLFHYFPVITPPIDHPPDLPPPEPDP